jgi:hypothetical protein
MATALGTSGPRRYLVLAQDPAELRPTGGFIGTVGVVEFDRGRIVERRFQGVDTLDGRAGLPHVEPPAPLAGHLLGDESWRLADANWSPDFPTAARQSLELYELETGDRSIDGVVALTTYAIDALLEVTGPVEVPGYGVTVRAGETTLTGLQQTRSPLAPGGDRKAFLDEFAGVVIDRLMTLPPGRWGEVIPAVQRLGRERLASVWLRDPRAQALVAEARLDGSIRKDAGDYVFAVDANVGPVSKLSLVTERRLALRVTLDPIGNAHNSLELSWDNAIRDGSGEPQRTLLAYQDRDIMGLFVRLIVPERSRLESVSGGELTRIEGPELIETEAGRTVFGNYLMVPPGSTTLRYAWVSPYPAEIDGTRGVYRLTIQKQPGTVDQRLRVEIRVPPGAEIAAASPTLVVEGQLATFDGSLTVDVELQVEYRLSQ